MAPAARQGTTSLTIGRNGSVLEVRDVGPDGLTLRARNGREGRVAWSSLATQSGKVLLAYGDAMTIHTAQGLSAAENILALPSGSQAVTGLQAYAGGTRHRQRSYLITSDASERAEIRNRRALNDPRAVTPDDTWANVARNFSHQPEKDIAVEMLERVETIRRGAVRQFPRALQIAEQRVLRGEAPAHIHEAMARQRTERALAPIIQRITLYVRDLHQKIRPALQRTGREAPAQAPEHQRPGPAMER